MTSTKTIVEIINIVNEFESSDKTFMIIEMLCMLPEQELNNILVKVTDREPLLDSTHPNFKISMQLLSMC